MIRKIWAVLLWGLLSGAAFSQSYLYLKTRTVDFAREDSITLQSPRARPVQRIASTGKLHLLVQFDAPPTDDDRELLQRRGATILDYVPDNSFLAIAPEDLNLSGMNIRWSGPLRSEDKVSPEISTPAAVAALTDGGDFVVAFHRDVSIEDARTLLTSLGIEMRDNPDLSPDHILVHATVGNLETLVKWDEVAYVFPASGDLARGRPTLACAGALTTAGPVGQYTARVGDGWDGPGLGSAQLSYVFGAMTGQLPTDAAKAEIVRALLEWSRVANVTFRPGTIGSALRTINILFASGAHGDGYPFDGPGKVLAHTFYPAPPNPEPLAGDMHLDDDEHWRIGTDIDLYSVVLHELGHALGLGHSDRPGSVMYPYYSRTTSLTAEDIGAILMLYAAADTAPPVLPSPLALTVNAPASQTTDATVAVSGTTSGGTAPIWVRWSSDRGDGGTATDSASWSANVNLQTGLNNIVFTAADSAQGSVSTLVAVTRVAAPVSTLALQITAPTTAANYAAAASSLSIGGTAGDSSGIDRVTWTNSRGVSGSASGTTTWSIGPLTLVSGSTVFTVRATARSGAILERTLTVTHTAPAQGPDVTPPTITVTSPASANFYTSFASINFAGTASDNAGVEAVRWSTNTGRSGVATGTTNWSAAIPVLAGTNYVKIQAVDAAGNTSWRTVVVVRY